MPRLTVTLDDDQDEYLAREADARDRSKAHVLREILDTHRSGDPITGEDSSETDGGGEVITGEVNSGELADVVDRLEQLERQVDKALASDDGDAPDATDDSSDQGDAASGTADTRNGATARAAPQNESGAGATPQVSTSSTTPDDLPAALDGVEFPGNRDATECATAVLAARAYLREHGSASMSEIVIGVMPEHPTGYDAESDVERINDPDARNRSTWWRKVVRPGLEAFDDVEKPPTGGSEWRYTGEADPENGGIYDPTGEF